MVVVLVAVAVAAVLSPRPGKQWARKLRRQTSEGPEMRRPEKTTGHKGKRAERYGATKATGQEGNVPEGPGEPKSLMCKTVDPIR